MRVRSAAISVVVLGVLAGAVPAYAGPPLLCHPFDIGDARSLPWDGTRTWWQGRAGYDIQHLVSDTEALLTPSMPVVVRMETLRRASLYASQDPTVARNLLERLTTRARDSESAGTPDALAYLDAAYVTGALHEIIYLEKSPEFKERAAGLRDLVKNADGYALIQRSLALRPDDAGLHFAAALIAADNNRHAYAEHAARARAGVDRDALLARNIQHVS